MIGDGETRSGHGVTKLQVGITTTGCRCKPHSIYCLPVTWKKNNPQQNQAPDVSLAMVRQDGLLANGRSEPVSHGEETGDVESLSSLGFDRRERAFMR